MKTSRTSLSSDSRTIPRGSSTYVINNLSVDRSTALEAVELRLSSETEKQAKAWQESPLNRTVTTGI